MDPISVVGLATSITKTVQKTIALVEYPDEPTPSAGIVVGRLEELKGGLQWLGQIPQEYRSPYFEQTILRLCPRWQSLVSAVERTMSEYLRKLEHPERWAFSNLIWKLQYHEKFKEHARDLERALEPVRAFIDLAKTKRLISESNDPDGAMAPETNRQASDHEYSASTTSIGTLHTAPEARTPDDDTSASIRTVVRPNEDLHVARRASETAPQTERSTESLRYNPMNLYDASSLAQDGVSEEFAFDMELLMTSVYRNAS